MAPKIIVKHSWNLHIRAIRDKSTYHLTEEHLPDQLKGDVK